MTGRSGATEIARFANPAPAVETTLLRDQRKIWIRTQQALDPVLEANKVAQGLYDPAEERRAPAGLRWVARLPAVVVMQLNSFGIMRGNEVTDEAAFLAFLDDPAHRWLRTDNGRRLRNLPKKGVA